MSRGDAKRFPLEQFSKCRWISDPASAVWWATVMCSSWRSSRKIRLHWFSVCSHLTWFVVECTLSARRIQHFIRCFSQFHISILVMNPAYRSRFPPHMRVGSTKFATRFARFVVHPLIHEGSNKFAPSFARNFLPICVQVHQKSPACFARDRPDCCHPCAVQNICRSLRVSIRSTHYFTEARTCFRTGQGHTSLPGDWGKTGWSGWVQTRHSFHYSPFQFHNYTACNLSISSILLLIQLLPPTNPRHNQSYQHQAFTLAYHSSHSCNFHRLFHDRIHTLFVAAMNSVSIVSIARNHLHAYCLTLFHRTRRSKSNRHIRHISLPVHHRARKLERQVYCLPHRWAGRILHEL